MKQKTDTTTDIPIKDEANDYKEKYLRALADYQNLEKQTQSWKEDFVMYANTGLIRKILEVLDDLGKAQDHLKDDGLQIVINKLKKILADEGLEELNLDDSDFDPAVSEVIGTKPADQANRVLETVKKGYKLKEKVIQPAKVIVSVRNQTEGQ